jgi:hypothetical protein
LKQASSGELWAAGGQSLPNLAPWGLEIWRNNAWSEHELSTGEIWAIAESASGNPAVGGSFVAVSGNYLRLTWLMSFAQWAQNDWSMNGVYNAAPYGTVLALQDGTQLTAGYFDVAGGTVVHNIAIWDGNQYKALGDGVAGPVTTIYQTRCGDIVAWGNFTRAGSVEANGIARWDGVQWAAMGYARQYNFRTSSIVGEFPDGRLLAYGPCSNDGQHWFELYAMWNGTEWEEFNSLPPEGFRGIAVLPDGSLIAWGKMRINDEDVGIARFDGTSWRREDNGMTDVLRLSIAPDGSILAVLPRTPIGTAFWFWDLLSWSQVTLPDVEHNSYEEQDIIPVSAEQLLWVNDTYGARGVVARVRGLWLPLASVHAESIERVAVTALGEILLSGVSPFGYNSRGPSFARYIPQSSSAELTRQPASVVTCLTGDGEFRVSARSLSPIVYQWEINSAGTGSPRWTPITCSTLPVPWSTSTRVEGFQSPILRLRDVDTQNVAQFRCRLRTLCGEILTEVVTLTVCPGDYNCDGGVDGNDVDAFIRDWTEASARADVNQDGGVDGADLQAFFDAREGGC